jgi:hypothetical protein
VAVAIVPTITRAAPRTLACFIVSPEEVKVTAWHKKARRVVERAGNYRTNMHP